MEDKNRRELAGGVSKNIRRGGKGGVDERGMSVRNS